MHKVQENQKVRIIPIEIAVPADADEAEVADEISALLSESGTANSESAILDWRRVDRERLVQVGADPEEGEVFYRTAIHGPPPANVRLPSTINISADRFWNLLLKAARSGFDISNEGYNGEYGVEESNFIDFEGSLEGAVNEFLEGEEDLFGNLVDGDAEETSGLSPR